MILSHILFIVGAVFLMYYRTLNYQFIIDDHDHIKTEVTPNRLIRIWEHFRGTKVTNLPLAHLTNILVHTAVCVLVYFVFGKNDVSFLTALLFAVNPVNNQTSIWLSGKVYGISTVLLLCGLLYYPLLPILYGLANWWSINTVFAPFLFLVLKPSWWGLVVPLGLLAIAEKNKDTAQATKARFVGSTPVMKEISLRKVIISLKTIGYYFSICIFPMKLGMCHSYLHSFGLSDKETEKWWKLDKYFVLGGIIVALVVSNLILNYYQPIYGLFWFLLFAVQWSNFIVLTHPISERYIYLPNIGIMYFLASLIMHTPLVWVFMTLYILRLYYFLPAYKDIKEFWKSNTENFPDVAMGYNQCGLGLLSQGLNGTALDTWITGLKTRPDDFRLNYNVANILVGSGLTNDGIRYLKKAEENIDPYNGSEFWHQQVDKIKEEIRKRGIAI